MTGESVRKRLLAEAMKVLARREHTRQELLEKLLLLSESRELLESVLDELSLTGWLSDERAAEALVRKHQERHGILRIRHEMQRRGVPEHLSDSLLGKVRETEVEAAGRVWNKKFSALPANADERARQARYLQNRGFSVETIRKVLRSEE